MRQTLLLSLIVLGMVSASASTAEAGGLLRRLFGGCRDAPARCQPITSCCQPSYRAVKCCQAPCAARPYRPDCCAELEADLAACDQNHTPGSMEHYACCMEAQQAYDDCVYAGGTPCSYCGRPYGAAVSRNRCCGR